MNARPMKRIRVYFELRRYHRSAARGEGECVILMAEEEARRLVEGKMDPATRWRIQSWLDQEAINRGWGWAVFRGAEYVTPDKEAER